MYRSGKAVDNAVSGTALAIPPDEAVRCLFEVWRGSLLGPAGRLAPTATDRKLLKPRRCNERRGGATPYFFFFLFLSYSAVSAPIFYARTYAFSTIFVQLFAEVGGAGVLFL